jgi:pyruvate,water dikinase
MSERELFDRSRELLRTHFRPLFAQHLFNTYCALVGAGVAAGVAEQAGDPTMAMKLVSGIGGVDSAGPAMSMWKLGRMAAGSDALTRSFAAGVRGLLERLRADDSEDARRFLEEFESFLYEFGSRGPNEWEMRSPTWETHPELALTLIDRMRVSPPEADPQLGNARGAAEREELSAAIEARLADTPDVLAQVHAGLRAAGLFLAARERSKTTIVRMINEARVAAHELGRRLVAAGDFDAIENFGVLLEDELDRFLDDPAPFREVIREREARIATLATLEPPFVLVGGVIPSSTWQRLDARHVEPAVAGTVLDGIPGCPGEATGRARVVLDPANGGDLEPGDVLVAPITDPSWTPLFVPAAAVVVDVGAQVSHAVIVSRELGIPCVVSVTDATRRITDGARVHVNGTTGVVTVLA